MSENEKKDLDLKSKIEILILECFSQAKTNKFEDLNFVFPVDKSEPNLMKEKIVIFKKLDIYSATFLSIHTRAKVALYELKNGGFGPSCSELLRIVLTLPDVLNNEKLKSIKVSEKELSDMSKRLESYNIGKEIKSPSKIRENTVFAKQGLTGEKLIKAKQKEADEFDDFEDIDFEDDSEDDFDDINL